MVYNSKIYLGVYDRDLMTFFNNKVKNHSNSIKSVKRTYILSNQCLYLSK